MTGKDLIIFILQNNLEDEILFENGNFVGFMSAEEAAVKFEVGLTTIKMWYTLGMIKGIAIDESLYIPRNAVAELIANL